MRGWRVSPEAPCFAQSGVVTVTDRERTVGVREMGGLGVLPPARHLDVPIMALWNAGEDSGVVFRWSLHWPHDAWCFT
jgi:hypothetical protein